MTTQRTALKVGIFTAVMLLVREIVKSCGSRVVRRPRTLGCRAMVPG